MARFLLSVALVAASLLSLAAAQSITFTQVASNTAFPPREYPACTQTTASAGSTPTLYFFGGFNVTLSGTSSNPATTANSYSDAYFNDAWSSSNFGQTWSQLTGSAAFAPQAWNGAVLTSSGTIVYIGGGGDNNTLQNNQVYTSTNGVTFTAITPGPWVPRENAGIAGQPGTNNILVALGNTQNAESVDDIWLSTNAGQSWNQTCHYTSCPFVSSVDSNNIAGQVHGPAAVGLSNGYWLLIGGYSNAPSGTSATTWVTNQVAVSTNGFVSWSTYTAPWSPRAQQRAVADADNYVYVYGGVYNLPLSGSGTSYSSVPSQVYYSYYQDMYYSTNPTSTSANWQKIAVSGTFGGGAGYPGPAYANNPNSNQPPASFYTGGAVFNPCLGVGYSSTGAKQLIVYTGLYAGYRQSQAAGVQVTYPGVYVGTLNITGGSTGAASVVGVSVVSVVAATLVAVLANLL